MKRINEWTHNFSERVDGLKYTLPFSVGDYVVAHFKVQTPAIDELASQYVMKVIQNGVPIQKVDQNTRVDVLGEIVSDGIVDGDIVEGVRVQLLFHKDGVYEDAGHGYKENLPVSSLRRVDRPNNLVTKSHNPQLTQNELKRIEKNRFERKRKQYGWD